MKWLKHSWTLQIKILSKDISAHTIYSAKTYVNAIRPRNYSKTKLLLTSDPEALPPKMFRHLTLIWTKGKKRKRKKGEKEKEKEKLVFEMCIEDKSGMDEYLKRILRDPDRLLSESNISFI